MRVWVRQRRCDEPFPEVQAVLPRPHPSLHSLILFNVLKEAPGQQFRDGEAPQQRQSGQRGDEARNLAGLQGPAQ
ncbi:hypothetical protein GCM10025871_32590 [Deinococcus metallilatus]|nr:hypothetical protein GCM10025871_32590 [Deinococcus metallilatus]